MGVDIAEVERIKAAIERHGETFLRRVYTPAERAYCEGFRNKYERYAGRFAAKEAAMKALGTGWRGLTFREISIRRDPRGKPRLELHGRALDRARALRVRSAEVSITHTDELAAACVALVTED